ncbi:MAG: sulfate adenylyltransferase [Bacteroidetes bacterium]|nr:sulfate adenylyltransferase [Bacteroidota bacterium]
MQNNYDLVNCVVPDSEVNKIIEDSNNYPEIVLNEFQITDLELIANGAYTPLNGFMNSKDYKSVLANMQLKNGIVWSLPITLPIDEETKKNIYRHSTISLKDKNKKLLAILNLEEIYSYDKNHEARQILGTEDHNHPGIARLFKQGNYYAAGKIEMINSRKSSEFYKYNLTPTETRNKFKELGWNTIVAFQTRNPIHRAHEYILKCALKIVDGLLIHPLTGETKAGDISADLRMRSYEVLLENYFPAERTMLSIFTASMRYAGPREAIFHAVVRRNYGCTHIIIGRDHAGVGNFYGSYDAQKIFEQFSNAQLKITPLFFDHSFYCKKCCGMASSKTCPHSSSEHIFLSGSKIREMLIKGIYPPPEFIRPEVAKILLEDFDNK